VLFARELFTAAGSAPFIADYDGAELSRAYLGQYLLNGGVGVSADVVEHTSARSALTLCVLFLLSGIVSVEATLKV